jgi:hypothetical protein
MSGRCLPIAGCLLLLGAVAGADDATDHGAPISRHWSPSTSVSTPHVPWMKPSVVGPVKVLVVQPWQGLREVVELHQRLDMTFDVIPVTSVDRNCDQTQGMFAYEQEDLAAKLAGAEVLMLCGIPPQWFTDTLWQAVLRRVEQGMGLVWTVAVAEHARLNELLAVRSGPPDYLLRGAPFALFKYINASTNFQCAEHGHGRVALWMAPTMFRTGWTTMTPVTPWAGNESFYAVAARLVTWASGRSLPARVRLPQPEIVISAGATHDVELSIVADQAIDRASVIWTVRNAAMLWDFAGETGQANTIGGPRQIGRGDLPVVCSTTVSMDVAAGENRVRFNVPALPDGTFVLDARLLDESKRGIDWDATALRVQGAPRIRWLALPPTGVPASGDFSVMVTLDRCDGPLHTLHLHWHASDIYGRTLSDGRTPWNGRSKQAIECALHHPLAKGVNLAVSLVRDSTVISRRHVSGLVSMQRSKPFRYGVYEPLPAGMQDLAVDTLVTGYRGDAEEQDLARFDLDAYLWLNGPSLYNSSAAPRIRQPCLNDSIFRDEYAGYLRTISPMLQRQRPVGALITDEWDYPWDHNQHYGTRRDGRPGPMHDLCHCAACATQFTEYLRDTFHHDLGRLNAAWGASFATWEQVPMPSLADVPGRFTPAATLSRLRFGDSVVARFFEFVNTESRQYGGSLRLGLSGTRPTDGINGYDYWQLAQHGARSFLHYGGPMVTQTMDFRRGAVFVSKWEGYSIWDASGADAVMWRAFIEGQDALIQYAAYPSYGTHHVDHRVGAGTAALGAAFREIDGGLAVLIRNAERVRSPIAIHYSPTSFATAAVGLGGGIHGTAMSQRVDQVYRLLTDGGLDPLFLSTAQIEQGELLKGGHVRALVLVDSVAMSDEELHAIEQFQAGGGVVLETSPAARFTQHGQPRPRTPAFTPFGSLVYAHTQQAGFGGELESSTGSDAQSAVIRGQVVERLAGWGIKPAVTVRRQGELACRVVMHRDGDANYYMVWPGPFLHNDRHERVRAEVEIEMPAIGHCYDLRMRRKVDGSQSLSRSIEEGDPVLLAVLPYAVESLQVKAFTTPVSAGDSVGFSVHVTPAVEKNAVDHAIEVTVAGPDGRPRPAYRCVQVARGGNGEIVIPLALNDTAGIWRVQAVDVTSGIGTTCDFEVVGRRD